MIRNMQSFQLRTNGEIESLICLPLEDLCFTNAFSTRGGGVSPLPAASLNLGNFSEDSRENILENRHRFLTGLGVADMTLVTARQIHSTLVQSIIDHEDALSEPREGDALATGLPQTLLGVQTADCLPILLADRQSGAVAVAHAGWRGTLGGIVSRTVETMQQCFQTNPSEIVAALGPAIGSCCFEVGPEVIAAFRQQWDFTDRLLSHSQPDGKGHLDINLANRLQLLAAGLRDEAIFDCKLCTVCHNDLFFSYRREKGSIRPVGRSMGVIGRAA